MARSIAFRPSPPRRFPRTRRQAGLALLAILVLLLLLGASPAKAGCRPGPRDAQTVAARIMRLPAEEFEALRQAPDRPRGFDWSTDGCSWTPASWAKRFLRACHLHDFGYRNFGNGPRFGRNEPTRRWIDGRFLSEMRRICGQDLPSRSLLWRRCRVASRLMYLAVRTANHWGT